MWLPFQGSDVHKQPILRGLGPASFSMVTIHLLPLFLKLWGWGGGGEGGCSGSLSALATFLVLSTWSPVFCIALSGLMTQMTSGQPGQEQQAAQPRQRHLCGQRPGGWKERGTVQEPGRWSWRDGMGGRWIMARPGRSALWPRQSRKGLRGHGGRGM